MMMSVGDVAVMTSPRADISWCRFGAWRCVKKVLSVWRRVKKVLGAWKRVAVVPWCVAVRGAREALMQNFWEACESAWRLR